MSKLSVVLPAYNEATTATITRIKDIDGSDGFTTNVVIPIRWGEEYD